MCVVVVAFFGWSNQAQLTIVGGTLEVVGLALVSVDFWWPWLRESWGRLGRATRTRARDAVASLRRIAERLRRKRGVRQPVSAGAATAGGIAPTGVLTLEKNPSLAGMVRRLYEIEARLGAVESRQQSELQEVRERLDAMTSAVQEMILRSKDEYLGWRVVGLAVALSGAVVLSAANLVSS